jgi:ATP-dependent helicase HrpB
MLAGFPDRVAKKRAGNQVLMSNGASAELSGTVPVYDFMVAVDAEDRKERALPLVRMTARIEPEWLIDLFPDRVYERSGVEWNEAAQRVEAVSELLYDELVLQSSRDAQPDERSASEMLARKAIEASELCRGLRSFAELKRAAVDFIPFLEQQMEVHHLRETAPASLRLQSGRQTKIHYEQGKQPWIASRLQDFFGMRETPRIGKNKTPVVVHLLAPNHRAVQTTTDLAGFWERLYTQVRRELMRRYPKHAWPERP